MPLDSKSPKGPKKGTKQHRPTAKEAAALKYSDSEEEGGSSSSSSSNSSSKSKNRQPVKPRQKSSSTKGSGSNPSAVVKHPKSRPNLILSKKTKSLMKQQQQAQAHKAQQKGGRNSPELKKTSPKSKAPKSKSRSGKVSGGGNSGGGGGRSSSGLSCSKSVGPKGTTTSKSPGGHSKQQLHQAKTSVETVGSVQKTGGGGGGNTIIFLGSPSDPAALELLKNLVKQINPSTSEAKQQQQPQQPTSASTTTTKTTTTTSSTSSPEDQTVVTDQTQLEEVYDAMYDLANNVKTIHDSYEKIVASLVNLQHRRSKTKKEGKGTVEKGGTLIPAATKSATSASSDGSEDAPTPPTPPATPTTTPTDPTDISRFMDARTRADAFAELFATVETLKEAMTPFNGCFNEGGFFQAATYAAETGRQITVGQRAAWLVQIRALNVTVEKLLAEYNREVLDMFRLVSSSGG